MRSHELLDLFDGSRYLVEDFVALGPYHYVVFDAHLNKEPYRYLPDTWDIHSATYPSTSAVLIQDVYVEILNRFRVGKCFIEELNEFTYCRPTAHNYRVNEVDSRLDGDHHALLQRPGRSKVLKAGLLGTRRSVLRRVRG